MAPRGKVALFVCPSTPFFLDALGFCHGDLKESAQKSYVLNQDFPFNHLSKRKRASPAHVSFKTVNCFSILAFLSCLVQLALTVKINENYIKIQRYQQRTASVFESTNRLGRGLDNHFQIEHPSVSAAHCELVLGNDGVRVRDCDSTNGTFVDGK